MAKTITATARRELVKVLGERYRRGGRVQKKQILDEFTTVTGYHRKHAIRILNQEGAKTGRRERRGRIYDDDVREALVVLWEAADRVCGNASSHCFLSWYRR